MFNPSIGVPERGCGTRVLGGVYAETAMGPNGHPIECFIKDPPMVIDPNDVGLSHIGVKLVEQDGVTYIFDWVSAQHYPNVSDFVEEARRFGASRRLPSTLNFESMGKSVMLALIHDKAVTFHDHYGTDDCETRKMSPQVCPQLVKSMHDGIMPSVHGPCARVWWGDHDSVDEDGGHLNAGELYTRVMPSLSYTARQEVEDATYQTGIFMILPLARIVVVRDPGTGSHDKTSETIREKLNGRLPVELVDE